ncbi:hypothetical protein R6Q57_010101, partial [Mikania cordata]
MEKGEVNYISQLSAANDAWKLRVRVLRLWKQSYQVDIILMDENGDKIQATIKKVLMCAFENQLEEGNIILLSRFSVGEMNIKYHVIKHSLKLNFYCQTNIKRCLEFDSPLYGFRFIDFYQIINRHVQVEDTV